MAAISVQRRAFAARDVIARGGATLAHANAGKNVILGVANVVAAVLFAFLAPVQWSAVTTRARLSRRIAPRSHRRASAPTGPMRLAIGARDSRSPSNSLVAYGNPREKTQKTPAAVTRASVERIVALGNPGADVDQILRRRVHASPASRLA